MKSIQDTSVFQISFDLLKDFHITRNKFPKTEKYTLGSRIEDCLLSILIQVIESGYAKKDYKSSYIERAQAKNNETKVLFRLAYEIDVLTEKQYLNLEERLYRLGQMLGGWKRSL